MHQWWGYTSDEKNLSYNSYKDSIYHYPKDGNGSPEMKKVSEMNSFAF